MQQNWFPRLYALAQVHPPEQLKITPVLFPHGSLQPLEDHKSCPSSPPLSRLNSPSALLKIINLLIFPHAFLQKQKVFYQPQLNHLFQHNGPTKTGRFISPIQTWYQERFNSIWDPSWDMSSPSSEALSSDCGLFCFTNFGWQDITA